MKDKLAGWYQGCFNKCFLFCNAVWGKSHRNVKAVWSAGITLSFSWWLWIDRQASEASMGKTLKYSILTGNVKVHSQWRGGKQEREVRYSVRNPPPPLSPSRMLVRSKDTLCPRTAPQEQGPFSGSLWVKQFSSLYTVKWNSHLSPWTVLMTNWTVPLSSAYCLMKSALLSESWVYFGTYDSTTLHVFSWVSLLHKKHSNMLC